MPWKSTEPTDKRKLQAEGQESNGRQPCENRPNVVDLGRRQAIRGQVVEDEISDRPQPGEGNEPYPRGQPWPRWGCWH